MFLVRHVVFLSVVISLCTTQPLGRKSPIKYIAGPNQVTLTEENHAFRFAYVTNNQFRAEKRDSNGTLYGFYGYIGADGRPVRVTYVSTAEDGYAAQSEYLAEEFPVPVTESESESATETSDANIVVPFAGQTIVSEENNSISVDSIDVAQYRHNLPNIPNEAMFTSPHADLSEGAIVASHRPKRSPQFNVNDKVIKKAFAKKIMYEISEGENAFIYAQPVINKNVHLTANTHITVADQ